MKCCLLMSHRKKINILILFYLYVANSHRVSRARIDENELSPFMHKKRWDLFMEQFDDIDMKQLFDMPNVAPWKYIKPLIEDYIDDIQKLICQVSDTLRFVLRNMS